MSSAERKDLSRAEWKVMKIVWELQKAMAREVYTIAGEQYSWTPATVKTILKRSGRQGLLIDHARRERVRLPAGSIGAGNAPISRRYVDDERRSKA